MYFSLLLALFVVLPVVELAILIKLGAVLGLADTLVLIVLTGVVGAILARWQGVRLLFDIQKDMAEGRMPAPRLLDGLMILVAGALLVTPGLITDAAGFLLLVPAFRGLVKRWLRRVIERKLRSGAVDVTYVEW